MKLKDIEVGEDYAVGSESFNQRGTVLEVGVYGQVWAAGGFRRVTSARPNYVQLVGHRKFRSPRTFLRPWAEQEVINAELLVKSKARVAEKERTERLRDAAPELLEAAKLALEEVDFSHWGSEAELALIAAIEKAEATP